MSKEVYLHDLHKWALSPSSFPDFKISKYADEINLTLEEDFCIEATTNTTITHILLKTFVNDGDLTWFKEFLTSHNLILTEEYAFLETKAKNNQILSHLETLFNYGQIWNLRGCLENKTLGELIFPYGEGVVKKYEGDENSIAESIKLWKNDMFAKLSEEKKHTYFDIYSLLKRKGMIAELLFRSLEENNVDFIDDLEGQDIVLGDIDDPEVLKLLQQEQMMDVEVPETVEQEDKDMAGNQDDYLQSRLQYVGDSQLLTANKDAVMMQWEYKIMKLSADSLFSKTFSIDGFPAPNPDVCDTDDEVINVLNIGFGMGIIDTYIQENIISLRAKYPQKQFHHYIIEAHPDVLKQMEDKKWFEKKDVHVLKGRWQDQLMSLLDQNIFFNGIYYDTFSEHYKDMLELYDTIIGMIKYENGIFSFFNGLGSDCVFFYDVYKDLVKLDLLEKYGLKCTYMNTLVDTIDEKTWDGITKNYFDCPVFYHPMITFNHEL
ncbi:protein-arginine N5-methyltransferase [Hanseniaspora uvarum]|nr:protein-arginine N5-methyltransferase [Hanseniaspora uvarum]